MLPIRVVLNRIFVYLVGGLDAEGREKLEAELYAPPEGWDAVDARVYAAMSRIAGQAVADGTTG